MTVFKFDTPDGATQALDSVLARRAVVAPPELDDASKQALLDLVDKTVKSEGWKKVLAEKNWTDLYLPGDQFAALIAEENKLTTEILKGIGLTQ